jgi:hypothetical protein
MQENLCAALRYVRRELVRIVRTAASALQDATPTKRSSTTDGLDSGGQEAQFFIVC